MYEAVQTKTRQDETGQDGARQDGTGDMPKVEYTRVTSAYIKGRRFKEHVRATAYSFILLSDSNTYYARVIRYVDFSYT